MKKQRYHFSYKGSYSQSYGFSSSHVQRWKLDYKVGWVPKNWWYQTVVLEKILESPLESRRPNHSVLKEITPGYSLEGLMPKSKLWPPDAKSQLIGKKKKPDSGKIESRRRRGQQRMIWLDGLIGSMDMSLSKLREIVKDREAWHTTIHGVTKSRTQLKDWTITILHSKSLVMKQKKTVQYGDSSLCFPLWPSSPLHISVA